MSSDLIGRRRVLEERLDRARALESFLKEKTDILVELTGMSMEEIDPDGSFRATLSAVAGVADRRTPFDVVVTLPDAPFAVRISHLANGLTGEIVVQRGGPYESLPDPAPQPQPQPQAVSAPVPLRPSRPVSVPQLMPVPLKLPVTAGAARKPETSDAPGLVRVASDLAALLWQDVDEVPS
jgi:hypothetical protein